MRTSALTSILTSIVTLAIALAPTLGEAQQPAGDVGADGRAATGGFLFAYEPRPGQRAAFEEGYRRHLDWHRAREDSLTWFGWDVMAGPRLGMFVDGVFGIRFAALDVRVDPAGDAADAARNVTAHAEPTARELVLLRPDLSTATPLEDGRPTPFAQVVRYRVRVGAAGRMESALGQLRRTARTDALLPYTVYEIVAGSSPGFLLVVWRDGLGSFDRVERNPERALEARLARGAADESAGEDADTGPPSRPALEAEVTSEVWRYRADLTYFGTEEGS